jgi:hypothetical protein
MVAAGGTVEWKKGRPRHYVLWLFESATNNGEEIGGAAKLRLGESAPLVGVGGGARNPPWHVVESDERLTVQQTTKRNEQTRS